MVKVLFVSGIDTDAGKSYCTGWMARKLASQGRKVITQKFVQTGCEEYSEDIEIHRRIMGIPLQPRDLDHTTAPQIFSYPCSPHLAARIDGRQISLDTIDSATATLATEHDIVLVEGAGGLLVPLCNDYLTIDYLVDRRLPLLLVVHGGLGSINHTLLSLEAVKGHGVKLFGVLYNHYFDSDDTIATETWQYLHRYIDNHFSSVQWFDVPSLPMVDLGNS